MLKPYIGTKIIAAEPMGDATFREHFKGGEQVAGNVTETPGYHVKYSNPDGSEYHSWSPKNVFERAYRPISDDEMGIILPPPCDAAGEA